MLMIRKREISDYVNILTYIWIKWIDNHLKSNDISLSLKKRRSCGERCEKLQIIRQKTINEINQKFNKKLNNE